MDSKRQRGAFSATAILALVLFVAWLGFIFLPSLSRAEGEGWRSWFGGRLAMIGGRFVDIQTGKGVVPVKAEYRLRLDGHSKYSDSKPLSVAIDGSFKIDGLPKDVTSLELRADAPPTYMRVPPVFVRFKSYVPRDAVRGLAGPILSPSLKMIVPITQGGVLRGSVHVSEGSLPKKASIVAFWDPGSRFDIGISLSGPIDDSGSFQLTQIPTDRIVRIAVGGLGDDSLLSHEVFSRVGNPSVLLRVTAGLTVDGHGVGRARGAMVHAIRRKKNSVPRLRSLPLGAPLDGSGRFVKGGLAPGVYDVVITRNDQVYAVESGVEAGTRDMKLGPTELGDVRGLVKGLSEGEEAEVEAVWTSRGLPLARADTENGHFSLSLPASIRCSLVARFENKVAFLANVSPQDESVVMRLVPGVPLRATIDGAQGPVFAMVDGPGTYLTKWIDRGADLELGSVVRGTYHVQLLSFAQAYSHFFSEVGGLVPYDESWAPAATLQTDTENNRISAPNLGN